MKHNCDKCGIEMEVDGDIKTTYGGIECTFSQYIELSRSNKNVMVVCKECLDKMPDASHFFESGDFIPVPLPEKNN